MTSKPDLTEYNHLLKNETTNTKFVMYLKLAMCYRKTKKFDKAEKALIDAEKLPLNRDQIIDLKYSKGTLHIKLGEFQVGNAFIADAICKKIKKNFLSMKHDSFLNTTHFAVYE